MYFHDTKKPPSNGYPAPPPISPSSHPANNNYHHYNNNHINHYCNDDLASGRMSQQRQSGNTAYIQKAAMNNSNRQTRSSTGAGYDGNMDSCNTEATLLSEYGE